MNRRPKIISELCALLKTQAMKKVKFTHWRTSEIFIRKVNRTHWLLPVITEIAGECANESTDTVLSGKWLLYQYQIKGGQTLIIRADTLVFKNRSDYLYNQFPATYTLYGINSGYRLSLNKTPFSDIIGIIPYSAPEWDKSMWQNLPEYGRSPAFII